MADLQATATVQREAAVARVQELARTLG